jgi:hypothetical protein
MFKLSVDGGEQVRLASVPNALTLLSPTLPTAPVPGTRYQHQY